MAHKYKDLKSLNMRELLEEHDRCVDQHKQLRETPETIRNEIFRRQIKRNNIIMIILTVVITMLTGILVYKEFI